MKIKGKLINNHFKTHDLPCTYLHLQMLQGSETLVQKMTKCKLPTYFCKRQLLQLAPATIQEQVQCHKLKDLLFYNLDGARKKDLHRTPIQVHQLQILLDQT